MISSTPFVVSGSGREKYATIQSAIDAAKNAGGGIVCVMSGIYPENLILSSNVDICGAIGIADTQTCIIKGQHLPPKTGTVTLKMSV